MNKRCIQRLIAGEESAFDEMYYEFHKLIYFIVFSMVRNKELAQEITDDAFVKAYHSIESYSGEGNFKYWLVQIAKNLARNELAKQARSPIILDEKVVLNTPDIPPSDEYEELRNKVLPLLDEIEFKVVTLKIYYNYRFIEIGKELGITVHAASGIYRRSIEKIKRYYKKGV